MLMSSVTENNISALGKQGERLFCVDLRSESESFFTLLTRNFWKEG